ncbi:hypothetical protein [Rhodococcus jostii]|uniref:phage upper tail fiber protein n=1 Tax=Rhodococcus jostii TaxID=132919 RepID=UPI0036379EC9
MTVISEPVANIAGLTDHTPVIFSVEQIRVRASGTGIVTTSTHPVYAVDEVLTTPDLDPGPAKVTWAGRTYTITIPESETPVALWPLIDAGLPDPTNEPGVVRNAGGIARIQRITESAYAALDTPDPETLYITFEG